MDYIRSYQVEHLTGKMSFFGIRKQILRGSTVKLSFCFIFHNHYFVKLVRITSEVDIMS